MQITIHKLKCRVFILDDMENRHQVLQQRLQQWNPKVEFFFEKAFTFKEACQKADNTFDIFCLDHDLADADPKTATTLPCMYGGSSRFFSGADFVDRMVNSEMFPKDLVWIHSANPDGATRMESALLSAKKRNALESLPKIIKWSAVHCGG